MNSRGLSKEELEEIKLFDLENRYQFLKRNAQEIIVKSKAYDQLYQEQLKRQFGIGTDELSEYIFGYTEDHLNRVLSKFNKDIMNEFWSDEQ